MNNIICGMSSNDIKNAYYMSDIIGYEDYRIDRLIQGSMREVFLKGFSSFKLYRDDDLYEKINGNDYNIRYVTDGFSPFRFDVHTKYENNNKALTTISYPGLQDSASYVFFGSKLHHAFKDINPNEIEVKNRVDEVVPMFYEMLCADEEIDKDISVEVLKRRLILIQTDEKEELSAKQLQLFNSYYYAIAMFNKYKNEMDKISMLKQISKVLKGEISTLDLLNLLDIYDKNMDYTVACKLDTIKEYIHRR